MPGFSSFGQKPTQADAVQLEPCVSRLRSSVKVASKIATFPFPIWIGWTLRRLMLTGEQRCDSRRPGYRFRAG